jgi:hypothetical protein
MQHLHQGDLTIAHSCKLTGRVGDGRGKMEEGRGTRRKAVCCVLDELLFNDDLLDQSMEVFSNACD